MTPHADVASRLRTLVVGGVLAYIAAVATVLAPSDAVPAWVTVPAQILAVGIPLGIGVFVVRRYPPKLAVTRLVQFAALGAVSGGIAAGALADQLLRDPASDTGEFVVASVVFVGLLIALAALPGAGVSWAYGKWSARNSGPGPTQAAKR